MFSFFVNVCTSIDYELLLIPTHLSQISNMLFDPLLAALEQELRTDFHKALAGLLAAARTRLEDALAEVAMERAQGLAEVATKKTELRREIEAMQTHVEQQQGRVELNIGGRRFQTSVQTLRRLPHTFFDAYFSGRYAQDVCVDGSIFVDRDGKHFGHVLEYMRDGVVSVADAGACPSVSLLRALKREFGYYCIDLVADEPAEPVQVEVAYVMGGCGGGIDETILSSMERYDAVSRQWSAAAAMAIVRQNFGACVLAGEVYVTGGYSGNFLLASVEKYSPLSDTWSAVAPMPNGRIHHVAVTVGSAMYVLGGFTYDDNNLKFDSTHGTWSEIAREPRAMHASAAVAVGTDIYVFGGEDNENVKQNSVLKYDTVADAWSTLAPMPHECSYHSASICNGQVYIVGAGPEDEEVLRFDPALGVWTNLAPTLSDQSCCTTFVLDGSVYAAGGVGNGFSVKRYDAATNAWTAAENMLEGRITFCAVTIGTAGPAKEQDLFDSLINKASRRQQ
jgi:hypothetical protein